MRLLLLSLALLPAAGCTLIDQRTFERAGRAPAATDLARADLPALPLLEIRFDTPGTDIQSAVTEAAEAVQSLKPDAEYDVLAPIPVNAPQPVQDRFAAAGQTNTAQVVSALGYAGVSLDRVHVGYRGDPGNPAQEVLVYVR